MERIHHHRDRKLWLAAAAILKPSPRKFIWGTKQKGCIGSKPTRDSGDNDHRKWEQGALEGADQIRAPNKPTLQARPTAGTTYHGEPSPRSDPAAAVNRPPPISRTRAESRRGRGKEGGKGKWREKGGRNLTSRAPPAAPLLLHLFVLSSGLWGGAAWLAARREGKAVPLSLV
jgi:hypothetical protein